MRKDTHNKSIAPTLDDLLNDGRLERLFSKDDRHCALQLWILQIKSEHSIENRVVYGRLLPYSHSSKSWSFSANNDYTTIGQHKVKITRLNLFIKSTLCTDLLRHISAGQTISEITKELKLDVPDNLKSRFEALGTTALSPDDIVYRPLTYLLNRNAYERNSPTSPHGDAGAFSASITQTNKNALFRLDNEYNVALTESVIKHLKADTGMDFDDADTTRFGDLELLVFPTLDDEERNLLRVDWVDASHALVARFNPMQVPYFSGFQFRLVISNDGQIAYSHLATAERNSEDIFECKFEVGNQLSARTDSSELEIFGFHGDQASKGTLCCRWRGGNIREIYFQSHVAGHKASPTKFDWLEKTTRPSMSQRVQEALTINRSNMMSTISSNIGGREPDPWVPINRDLASLFARLYPPKSEARFFLRWGQGDGEGRLQFVEWFRALLANHLQHQVIIFDPYFEDVGLRLLLLGAAAGTDCIVFRTLPKPTKEGVPRRRKSDKVSQDGVNNLLANCEQSSHLLERIKLRIYGLKEGRLHDRYILIMGPDGLPAAGFHLSNSFQKATENYPLMVTPIPADTLLLAEKYKSGLVQEAMAVQSESETENPSIQLLYDSTALPPTTPRRYEPLRFLEKDQAGDVLSVWANEPALRGLSGDQLRVQMAALNLLENNSLALPETTGLCNCLDQQNGDFADFTPIWEVIGEMLAHSRFGDRRFREIESERVFLEFLARFIEQSFNRIHGEENRELTVLETRLFKEPIESLLHSSFHPLHLAHATKYVALTWAEYFAIQFLWWYAPATLLEIAETQMIGLPIEPQAPDAVKLSLLSQIVSEIAQSIQLDINVVQRNCLIGSSNGLLHWMGLNAIEIQLEKPGGLTTVKQLIASFAHSEQVRVLGWMVHHAARNQKNDNIYKGLVAALHETLSEMIDANELKHLIDSMRGHMRQLAWAEPWLFQDVVFPLLHDNRSNIDDACDIWMQELVSMLEPKSENRPQLFSQEREGQTTNITAFLYANSSSKQQQDSLNTMQTILNRQRRIVQQPLASTSDWTKWDGALTVSMWILAFTRWAQYYLRECGTTDLALDQLAQDASKLAMARPMIEWRSEGPGKSSQLAAFLDQINELLASSDE